MNNLRQNPIEETEMPLYGGIDLHANNSVVVLLDEQDQMIYTSHGQRLSFFERLKVEC